MPDHVTAAAWVALAAGWLISGSVYTWMEIRARRRDLNTELAGTKAVRRIIVSFHVFLSACIASEVVPLLSGAPRAASIFWLLAVVSVAYAGLLDDHGRRRVHVALRLAAATTSLT